MTFGVRLISVRRQHRRNKHPASDHRVSFDTPSRRVGINVGRFEDCRFQGHTVLQVFCEFGLDELFHGGETE
jgi:hypothetical protein